MLVLRFPHPLLQLGQRQIGLTLQPVPQMLLYLRCHPAPRTTALRLPLHLTAALVLCRYLQRIRVADSEPLGQLAQTSIPAPMRLQQLPPQIVRICSRHPCSYVAKRRQYYYTPMG